MIGTINVHFVKSHIRKIPYKSLFNSGDTTLCDKVCQCLWFSPVSSTNKTDCHDITEILLKMALNIINQTNLFLNRTLDPEK